jgi:hypothetical protein
MSALETMPGAPTEPNVTSVSLGGHGEVGPLVPCGETADIGVPHDLQRRATEEHAPRRLLGVHHREDRLARGVRITERVGGDEMLGGGPDAVVGR